jgi:hypothetical protein
MEEPMSNTLEIPADFIPDVRAAVLCMLGDGTESIAHALALPEHELHPEWFVKGRDETERTCTLLDEIGWDGTLRPQATSVDLDQHGATLREALERYLPLVENWLEEAPLNDRWRAEHGKPPEREELSRRVLALGGFIEGLEQRT